MATNPDPNGGVYRGPYVDPAITKAAPPLGAFGSNTPTAAPNPEGTVPDASPADAPGSEPSGSTTLGEVKVYDTPEVNHEPGDQGAVPPPHSPNNGRSKTMRTVSRARGITTVTTA